MPKAKQRGPRPKREVGEPLWGQLDWPTRLVIGATLTGFILRVLGIAWGLPGPDHLDSYHPDEWTVYSHAARIAMTGDLNPHFFNYGSFPLVLGALLLRLSHAAGELPSALGYLVLRGASLVAGCGTIVLSAWIARTVFRTRWAMVPAAWVCAVAPVHVQCSQFATVDVLAGCLLAGSLACGLKLLEEDRLRWLVLAGVLAGLGAATKYVGILSVLPALAAYALGRGTVRSLVSKRALLIPGCAILAFLVGCPYAVLDWQAFQRDFLFEATHIREGATTEMLGKAPLWYFSSEVLPCALTAPLLGLVGVAAAWAALRRERGGLVLLGWAMLITLAHATGREIFVRYVVASVPFLAALTGILALAWEPSEGVARRRSGVALSVAALVGCAGYALLVSWAMAGMMARPDSRDASAGYLRSQLADGGSLGFATKPWFYTPPVLYQNIGPRMRPERVLQEADARGIDLAITGTNEGALDLKQPEWFVLSEFEYYWQVAAGRPEYVAFLSALEARYDLVRVDEGEMILGPLKFARPRLHDWRYVSPEIRVYQRKGSLE